MLRSVVPVYLEVGAKRVFACALPWPGWCRVARNDDEALRSLAAYAPRYERVAKQAGIRFAVGSVTTFDVVERVKGSATTDFGAPGSPARADDDTVTAREAQRIARLVDAAWAVFDDVMGVAPKSLRKGPRGGGRDRDAMIEHVLDAEAMYAKKLGVRVAAPRYSDSKALGAERTAITDVLRSARAGTPVAERGWPPRYAARRIAWHVLDHAWECEDRSR